MRQLQPFFNGLQRDTTEFALFALLAVGDALSCPFIPGLEHRTYAS
jgi:hypothetical protein